MYRRSCGHELLPFCRRISTMSSQYAAGGQRIRGLNGVKQANAPGKRTVTRYWLALTDAAGFESAATTRRRA